MPRPTTRTVLYRGRKRDLIRLVDQLCALKKRPVCSSDLQEYLSSQEEAQVGYIQPLGQICFKAAIPRPAPIPVLVRIGIHLNRAYYAADANPAWNSAFQQFCACERAEFLIKRGFLTCFAKSDMENVLLQAAAASLCQIIEGTLPLLTSAAQISPLRRWLEDNCPRSTPTPPHKRINRAIALRILKTETAERIPWVPSMNFQRHLARVSPAILRPDRAPRYCEELLYAYCAAQWPVATEHSEQQTRTLLWWTLAMLSLLD